MNLENALRRLKDAEQRALGLAAPAVALGVCDNCGDKACVLWDAEGIDAEACLHCYDSWLENRGSWWKYVCQPDPPVDLTREPECHCENYQLKHDDHCAWWKWKSQ